MFSESAKRILDIFAEGIVISDPGGIILFSNARYSDVSAIASEQIVGKSAVKLVREGLFDLVLNPEIVRSGTRATRIQQVSNGRRLLLDGHPVPDDAGQVSLVLTFIRDESTLAELQELAGRQRDLLNTFTKLHNSIHQAAPPPIFQSGVMRRICGQLNTVAPTDATVLILGETGVGKDVLARRIHKGSLRADKPFIKVDCGSIPENLIETELFGYEPGAFSGGSRQGKMGLVEAAAQGTLFLDEIGELPRGLQTRLLRVLQDREIMRVGALRPRPVDVRVLAATNKDLEQEVAQGRFRSDLYYRLKVAVIEIPPLRRRTSDILPLARAFFHYYGQKYRRQKTLAPEAEALLAEYSWPGNVRELENLVQSVIVQHVGPVVRARDLRLTTPETTGVSAPPAPATSYKEAMEQFEYALLARAMEEHGSLTRAAEQLKMDRSTLFRKLKMFTALGYPPCTCGRRRKRRPGTNGEQS